MILKNNILLIDDDNITSYLHQRLLQKLFPCLNILSKKNGEDALNYLKSCISQKTPLPEIILLDLNMPVMNGFEFLHILKKMNSPVLNKIPVIVLSSSEATSDKEKVESLGASSYWTKPLCKSKVEGMLENRMVA